MLDLGKFLVCIAAVVISKDRDGPPTSTVLLGAKNDGCPARFKLNLVDAGVSAPCLYAPDRLAREETESEPCLDCPKYGR